MVPDPKTNPEPQIKDFLENHTDSTVSFTIHADKAKIDEWEMIPKGGLYAKFKLTSTLNNSNMTVFDPQSRIIKYEKPEDIMKEFYNYRLDFYVRRKALLVQKLEKEQRMLSNKARFVEEICSGALVVSNRKKVELLNALQERGYELFDNKAEKKEDEENEDEEETVGSLSKGYEYLLGMKIWSLTYEKAEELRKQLRERTAELEALQATPPSQIWLNDLDSIEVALDERDVEMEEAEENERRARSKNKKHQAKKAKQVAASTKRGKKKADDWDSDLEDDSDDEPIDVDSDEEIVPVKKPAAPRNPPAKKTATAKKVAVPKPAAVAPAVKPSVKAAASKGEEKQTSEVVDIVELSLAERMAKLLSPSKTAASTTIAPITTNLSTSTKDEGNRGTKRPSPKNSDMDDDDDEVIVEKVKPQPKRTKAAATKKAAPKKAPVSKGRKKKEPESDSEDDFDFDEEEREVVAAAPAPRAGGRSARAAAKKVVYTLSSDEEGSDSDY